MIDLNKVSRDDVYRYMGFRDELPELHIREMCEKVIDEVSSAASPKFCAFDTHVNIADNKVMFNSFEVVSSDLSKHLTGCDNAVLLAATLGSGVDMIIYKFSLTSPAKALASQAAATAMIEAYADFVCKNIADTQRDNGLYLTSRFSPGYGDFLLKHQSDILNVLDASKRIGLCITEADMLTPVKSITAVVGKTKNKTCKKHKCSECLNKNCVYKSTN